MLSKNGHVQYIIYPLDLHVFSREYLPELDPPGGRVLQFQCSGAASGVDLKESAIRISIFGIGGIHQSWDVRGHWCFISVFAHINIHKFDINGGL